MARKFQGAAKGRGFNPVSISSANITRMREENERILRGMRERRESQRNNEQRQLEALQANANYYQQVRDRDFKIASTNLENEQKQLQYNEAERVAQHNANTKAISGIFDDIVKFSETAAKAKALADEKEAEKRKDQIRRDRERSGPLTKSDIAFRKALDAEEEGQELVRSSVQEAKELGSPEYEVQKALGYTYNESVTYIQHDTKLITQAEWPTFRAEWFRENAPEALGSPEQTQGLMPQAWKAFEAEKGWTDYSTELLGTALDAKRESDKSFISGVTDRATQRIAGESITILTNAAIADWNNQGANSFRGVGTVKNFTAAHAWFKEQATAMDANGNFILSDSQWMNTDVRGDGTVYFTGNPKEGFYARGLDILNAREDKRREWARGVATDDRLSYNEESKAWHRHIVIDGNSTPEDLAAAAESFRNDVKGQPEWLRKLTGAGKSGQGQYNSSLITQAKDLEARGMLYQGLVDKVFEVDPKQGNTLQKSLNEQDPFMRDDFYKQYYDSIDKLPLVQDLGGNYPEPNADAIRATGALRDAYRELVKRAVADGAAIKDAGYSSMKTIESGFTDPNSPFYRVYNPNTAQYEFKKLYTKTPKEIAEDLDQADTDFLKRLDNGQIQDVFSDPDMILTDAQWDANVASMSRPGYTFPARVEMLVQTGHLKGSHMEIMQRIGQEKGRPPIQPPPSLQAVGAYPPKANQMLALWGPRSSNIEARAHGAGQQTSSPEVSLALVPENLREFYQASATRHGVSPAENAAMGEIESAHGKYAVSYNGTSFGVMQINKSAHPAFFAKHNGNPSDEANIEYGTQYYAGLKDRYRGDSIAAAMAYNGGPGNYELWLAGKKPGWVKTTADEQEWERIVNEMTNHGKKFAKAYYKYSGDTSLLQNPLLLRN